MLRKAVGWRLQSWLKVEVRDRVQLPKQLTCWPPSKRCRSSFSSTPELLLCSAAGSRQHKTIQQRMIIYRLRVCTIMTCDFAATSVQENNVILLK